MFSVDSPLFFLFFFFFAEHVEYCIPTVLTEVLPNSEMSALGPWVFHLFSIGCHYSLEGGRHPDDIGVRKTCTGQGEFRNTTTNTHAYIQQPEGKKKPNKNPASIILVGVEHQEGPNPGPHVEIPYTVT